MNYEVIGDKSTTGGPLTFVLVLIVLCVLTFVQYANAQSVADRDVSGTTWDCRVESNNEDGRLTGIKNGDHVLITFDPGGSSITAKPISDQAPAHIGEFDWSFGEWKQVGSTVRSVSNGTVESFHDQPWNDGDAERMLELKVSGDQMQGRLLSHSTTDLSVFHCQLQTLLPNSGSPANVNTGTNVSPPVVPASPVVDVRVTSADSRILTSAEMAAIRDSLHWEPESVPFRSGGTAVSYLLDNLGHTLGSIRVQWTKTVVSKGTRSQPADPPVGSFRLEIQNGTSCGFLAQAELEGPKGSVIVSSVDIDSWVGLHQPGSGETIRVEGDAVLPNPNPTIVLRPLAVGSALSACLTPKRP